MTTNVHNSGIAHLAFFAGGKPFCSSRRAHIVCAAEDAFKWPVICKRCEAKLQKMHNRKRDAATRVVEA
jgi:hypothetical protein